MSDDARWVGFRGTVNDRYKRNVTETGIYADVYLLEVATGRVTRLTENAEVGRARCRSPRRVDAGHLGSNDWTYFRDRSSG